MKTLTMCAIAVVVVVGTVQAETLLLLQGGSGDGFCGMMRRGRHVQARVVATGFDASSIGTVWIKENGAVIGHLPGTFADASGHATFTGAFKTDRKDSAITLDVRDHHFPIDSVADHAELTTELTSPGSGKLGTCTLEE